ncbi:PhoH family protein [Bacteroidetes/Chlorobi group bacterium MS-B_bin-24]|jgi:phosphate starvation-inducible PhoH-like protein|nr:MAG: PhoH family protein [Bacteroidetes/Chlorobi group bacterium MS-B_bin-24]
MEVTEKTIHLEDKDFLYFIGYNDQLLQVIENKFNTLITLRGSSLVLKGSPEEVKSIEAIFKELGYIHRRSGTISDNDLSTVLELMTEEDTTVRARSKSSNPDEIVVYHSAKGPIKTKNLKQVEYVKKVAENDIVFAIGPAGTGKTFLAVAMALAELKKNRIEKIILSRPAVETGESLGFLPGDLKEKLDPYLKPLTDALYYMLSSEKLKTYSEKNIIEIIPLAYMRGRTLSNAFIILDEAQNATITQMKMFLTRMGNNSKVIVTGDITQIDLQNPEDCGLINANKLLQNIEGIAFVYFDEKDVVRHKLVARIIKAYQDEAESKQLQKQQKEKNSDKT